ncbi:hypothetical protein BgiMline_031707, partial [Biomphalaria glabrata]
NSALETKNRIKAWRSLQYFHIFCLYCIMKFNITHLDEKTTLLRNENYHLRLEISICFGIYSAVQNFTSLFRSKFENFKDFQANESSPSLMKGSNACVSVTLLDSLDIGWLTVCAAHWLKLTNLKWLKNCK